MAVDASLAAIRSVLVPRLRGQRGVEPGLLQTVTLVAKFRWPELGSPAVVSGGLGESQGSGSLVGLGGSFEGLCSSAAAGLMGMMAAMRRLARLTADQKSSLSY
jgi:hypothetical protein